MVAKSARLAMISSTGAAVPAVDTPRSFAFGKRFLTQFSSPPPVKYATVTSGLLNSSIDFAFATFGLSARPNTHSAVFE